MSYINGKKIIKTYIPTYLDLDTVYPVGSVYISVNSTSPASLFGGTWELIQSKFLLGTDDLANIGETGGNATHYHILDDSGYAKIFGYSSTNTLVYKEVQASQYWTNNQKAICSSVESDDTKNDRYGIALGGGTASANNMPPYIKVAIWKRTA